MRKALTLVELIFTIVIIALVFTVIPKVMYSLTKSDNFSIRQDALFAGVSLANTISRLPWDEQNNLSNDILHVDSANFDCSAATTRRVGSFVGSRECDDNLTALPLSNDGEADYGNYNDVDDFVDENVTAKIATNDILYELKTSVTFIDDNFSYDYTNKSVTANLKDAPDVNYSTNLKKVEIVVNYAGNRGPKRQLTQFGYISSNIGQIFLNKRAW